MKRDVTLPSGCVLKVEVRILYPETALVPLVDKDIDEAHLDGLLINGYRVLCHAFGLGVPREDA
jgi:hypothetical protein